MVYNITKSQDEFEKIFMGSEKVMPILCTNREYTPYTVGSYVIITNQYDETQRFAVKIKSIHIYENFTDLFSYIYPVNCGFKRDVSAKEAAEIVESRYDDVNYEFKNAQGIEVELVDLKLALDEREEYERIQWERYFPDGEK